MIFIGLSFIILAFLAAYYFLYLSPKRKIQSFAQHATSLGYKVKLIPFQFMKYYMAAFEQHDNGSLVQFKQQMHQYDLIIGNMFGNLAIMPVNLDILKEFYSNLNKLPKNPFISEVFLFFLNGGGLVFTQGNQWKRRRRIISSSFHFDFINQMVPIIDQEIDLHFQQIQKAILSQHSVDIRVLAAKVLASVIAKSFFGTDMTHQIIQGKTYSDYFLSYLEEVNAFTMSSEHAYLGMLGPKYGLTKRCRQIVRKLNLLKAVAKDMILQEIQKIKQSPTDNKNLLTTLLNSGLLNTDSDNNLDKLSIQELICQFFTFVGAGTDITSHSNNLMLHYLSDLPQYTAKIREQVQALDKRPELSLTEKVKKMEWVQSIFNETLRINGPISQIIPRISSEDLILAKLKIPKGTCFNVLPLISHYNPENFEEPQVFKPERWMNDAKIVPYSFMPFAGGERNCIGQYLARVETKMMVSKMLKKYDIKAKYPIEMKKRFFFATQHSEFIITKRQ